MSTADRDPAESRRAERERRLTDREAELARREREVEQLRGALEAQRARLEEVRAEYEGRREMVRQRAAELEAERDRLRERNARDLALELENAQQPTGDVPLAPPTVEVGADWWSKQLGAPLEAA